jgi:AcrR family transcriptional regulator
MATSRSSPPTAERLTLEAIVDAAAELVARDGFDGLSMRKLAQHCDVGAMTLYGYVATKDELLAALADRFLSEVRLPRPAAGNWEEQVASVFRSVRRVFLQHPELTRIVAERRADGMAAYRGAEIVFRALRTAGLSDPQIVSAFGALTSFTVGSAQREIGFGALPGIEALPRQEFSHVIGLAGLLVTRNPEQEFEAGLDLLITGIKGWRQA